MVRAASLGWLLALAAAPVRSDCELGSACRAYAAADVVAIASAAPSAPAHEGGTNVMRVHERLKGESADLLPVGGMRFREGTLYLLYLEEGTRWGNGAKTPGVAGPGPLQRSWVTLECGPSKPLSGARGAELEYVLHEVRRLEGKGSLDVEVVVPVLLRDEAVGVEVADSEPVPGAAVTLHRLGADEPPRHALTGHDGRVRFSVSEGLYRLAVEVPSWEHAVADRDVRVGRGHCPLVRVAAGAVTRSVSTARVDRLTGGGRSPATPPPPRR